MKSNNSFHLRKQEPLLANDGQFEFIQLLSNEQLVAYRMYNEQQSILVFINPTDHEQTFTLPFETKNIIITNLLTNHMNIQTITQRIKSHLMIIRFKNKNGQ